MEHREGGADDAGVGFDEGPDAAGDEVPCVLWGCQGVKACLGRGCRGQEGGVEVGRGGDEQVISL